MMGVADMAAGGRWDGGGVKERVVELEHGRREAGRKNEERDDLEFHGPLD